MSHLEEVLKKNERIIYRASVSLLAYLPAVFLFVLLFQPFGIARLATTELAITNQRLIGMTGLFKRKSLSVPFASIYMVRVQQGFLGWILDYGTFIVFDKEGYRSVFKGIACPALMQQEINEAIEIETLGKKLVDFAPAF